VARFRFRAAAALDLRLKQERDAEATYSRAEAAFRRVKAHREDVHRTRLEALQAELELQQRGADGTALTWHRTWIEGLVATAARLGHELEARAEVVAHAKRAWLEARRKRRTLERMRDRAWQRFRREQDRQERIVLDELARLRFLMPEFGGATSERDHRHHRPIAARQHDHAEHHDEPDDRQRLPGID